jgi:hypothetical protein
MKDYFDMQDSKANILRYLFGNSGNVLDVVIVLFRVSPWAHYELREGVDIHDKKN